MFRPLYLREETTWHPLVGPQSWSKRFLKKSIIDPRLLGCPAPWLYAAWPIAVPTHRLWNAGKYCLFLNTKTQKRIWPFELGFTTACWPSCFAVCVRVRKIPQQKDTQGRGGTVPPLINISPPTREQSVYWLTLPTLITNWYSHSTFRSLSYKFVSYLTVNTMHLQHKHGSVDAVYDNKDCLRREMYDMEPCRGSES